MISFPNSEASLIFMCGSYLLQHRQGMHELAGVLYYVVEAEAEAWLHSIDPVVHVENDENNSNTLGVSAEQNSSSTWENNPLRASFGRDTVEAYVFWLFKRLMDDLKSLYDPNPAKDGQPPILHYCFAVQGEMDNNTISF